MQDNEIPSKSVHTKTLFNCFLHVYLILRWRITCKRIFFKFKARILKIDFRWSIWLNFCRKLKITGCKATSLSNPTSFRMNWWADLTYFWQVECNQIRDEHKSIINIGQAILKGFFSHFILQIIKVLVIKQIIDLITIVRRPPTSIFSQLQ